MFKKLCNTLKNRKGFTLVELMVVVVIIGILAGIAVPVYSNVTAKAEKSAIEANLRTIDGAIMMALSTEPEDAVDTLNEVITLVKGNSDSDPAVPSKYLQEWPDKPGNCVYSIISSGGTFKAQVVIPADIAGLSAEETSTLAELSWR